MASSGLANSKYQFDAYDVADGLTQSSVLAIAEDARGVLWFGTQSGISLYDGYTFSDLDGLGEEHRYLTASTIIGLHRGSAGEMWIATARGVSRVEWPSKQVMSAWHHEIDPTVSARGYGQAQFLETCSGAMVVARDTQVFLIETTAEGLEQTGWLSSGSPRNTLWRRSNFSMVKDAAGTLWVADAHRLWRSTCQNPALELVAERDQSTDEHSTYTQLILDDQERLYWVSDAVMSIWETESGEILDSVSLTDQLGQDVALVGVAGDGENGIWSLSQAGLHQWAWSPDRPTDARWQTHLIWDASGTMGFVSDAHKGLSLARSGDGLLWALSDEGLMAIEFAEDSSGPPDHLPARIQRFPELSFSPPRSLYQDRFGVVWFSAGLQGLRRYSPERHRFGAIQDINLSNQSVRSLQALELVDGQYLWVGWDHGVVSLLKKNGLNEYEALAQFDRGELSSQEMPWGTVYSMARDSRDQVWLANSR